jgi:hypothetical protein
MKIMLEISVHSKNFPARSAKPIPAFAKSQPPTVFSFASTKLDTEINQADPSLSQQPIANSQPPK